MTPPTEATSIERVKSAYCLYCKAPRFPDEIRTAIGMRGQKIKRCTHCLQFTAPQAKKRI